jgi:hypothetical protein
VEQFEIIYFQENHSILLPSSTHEKKDKDDKNNDDKADTESV